MRQLLWQNERLTFLFLGRIFSVYSGSKILSKAYFFALKFLLKAEFSAIEVFSKASFLVLKKTCLFWSEKRLKSWLSSASDHEIPKNFYKVSQNLRKALHANS
jgi:hypothetical protein